MKHLLAVALVSVAAAVLAPMALADAPSPLSLTGTSVTNADGSRTLTVNGTFGWEKGKCDSKSSGYAIAWNDPTSPGNVVANGVAVGTQSDNTIHTNLACGNPGTFGPLSHTYPASVTAAVQVCAVTYHNKDSKKTAGGSNRQTDNSVEENKDGKPAVCFTFAPPPPPDVCPNIAGIQTTVPAGMSKDSSGNCVTPPPTDVCPNIEGIQTTVPSGMSKDASGNCITPTVALSPPPATTVTVEKVIVKTVVKRVVVKAKAKKKVAKKPKKVVKAAHKVVKPRVLPHTR